MHSTVRARSHRRAQRVLGALAFGVIVVTAGVVPTAAPVASAAGSGWSASASTGIVPGESTPFHVSCASASFCAAVAVDTPDIHSQDAVIYNGSSWSAPTNIDQTDDVIGLSCVQTSFCMALDQFDALTYNGNSWSPLVELPVPWWDYGLDFDQLSGLSCASASFCVAVDNGGDAYTYNGSSWSTSPTDIDGSVALTSVSCPSTSFCMAVDWDGDALTYNGGVWSSPTDIDGGVAFASLSCPSSSFCMAVNRNGDVLTYNGSAWSAPTDVGVPFDAAMSCGSATLCAAVYAYSAWMWNGSSWSGPSVISDYDLTSVSCPSASFCMAVDDGGDAFTYSPPTTTPTTEPGAPSGPLRATRITATSITLSWGAPKKGPRPSSYAISFELGPQAHSGWSYVYTKGSKTTFTVRHLKPRTRYRFEVQSVNASGRIAGGNLGGPWVTTK